MTTELIFVALLAVQFLPAAVFAATSTETRRKMNLGTFKMFNAEKGFGFILAPNFPGGNVFCPRRNVLLPPGEYPQPGDECTFEVGHDALGRPVANEVALTRRAERAEQDETYEEGRPYIQRGRRREYLTTSLTANQVGSMRERARAEAERVFTIHGEDEAY
jgi:cold shock CspA family protein